MIIELSYGQVFWIGMLVGIMSTFILKKLFRCLSEVKLSSITKEERQEMLDMKNFGYLPVTNYLEPMSFEYKPVDYLKNLKSGDYVAKSNYEARVCLSCLRKFAREVGSDAPNKCESCIKSVKNKPPLPEYNPNK